MGLALYSWLRINNRDAYEATVLRQRFESLRQQVPWIYGLLAANVVGLEIAIPNSEHDAGPTVLVFLAIIAIRATHWFRIKDLPISEGRIQSEMVRSFALTCFVCAAFTLWGASVYHSLPSPLSLIPGFFVGMFGVGACYGLIHFPHAARAAIFLTTIPFILLMFISGSMVEIGVAFSFVAGLAVMNRIVSEHDTTFVRLIRSRFETDREHRRAVKAESEAVLEKARVSEIAKTDALTGLHNRRGFLSELDRIAEGAASATIIIFDLDGFKPINDTYGHLTGDALLIEVSSRLCEVFSDFTVFRLGGDEFAVLAEGRSAEQMLDIARVAIQVIEQPFNNDGKRMTVSACAGVASCSLFGQGPEVMREADLALYTAKAKGRGQVECFTENVRQLVERRTQIEQALCEPDIASQIEIAYQPVFDIRTMKITAFEALARWRHSELGWISPAEFIPITEQLSLVERISEELLARACRDALGWPSSVRLSFNFSPQQICAPEADKRIRGVLAAEGLDPARLQVEVTETAILSDFDAARNCLSSLRRSQVQIALDDFGAGYASITYLREMEFDAVKIDGSLVRAINESGSSFPLLKGVLALCQSIEVICIAEHIETEIQLAALRKLGCQHGQGFILSKPLAPKEAAGFAHTNVGTLANPWLRAEPANFG